MTLSTRTIGYVALGHLMNELRRVQNEKWVKPILDRRNELFEQTGSYDDGGEMDGLELLDFTIDALGQIGDKRAVELLIYVLKRPDLGLDLNAARALAAIGDSRAIEPIIESLNDPDEGFRGLVVYTLRDFEDERVVNALISRLSDSERFVIQAAKEILGGMGQIAVNPLTRLLVDASFSEPTIVVEILQKIGTPDALAAVEEWQGREKNN